MSIIQCGPLAGYPPWGFDYAASRTREAHERAAQAEPIVLVVLKKSPHTKTLDTHTLPLKNCFAGLCFLPPAGSRALHLGAGVRAAFGLGSAFGPSVRSQFSFPLGRRAAAALEAMLVIP